MDFEAEYSQNRTQMKRIKKEDKIYFIICAANLVVFLFSLFFLVVAGEKKYLLSSFASLLASAFGVWSLYKKHFSLAVAAVVLAMAEFVFVLIISVVSIFTILVFGVLPVFGVRNVMNVGTYNWLRQQDGFPYFEPKQRMNDLNRVQWGIKDPYTLKKERYEQNSTGHMDNI